MYRFASPDYLELSRPNFRENRSLRSLVLRTPFPSLSELAMTSLWTSISTITSPTFSEFVLELVGRAPAGFPRPPLDGNPWGNWDEIDTVLNGFLEWCPDLKLVIRTGRLRNRDEYQAQARERFPLMTGRGRIHFETSLVIDKYQLSSWY